MTARDRQASAWGTSSAIWIQYLLPDSKSGPRGRAQCGREREELELRWHVWSRGVPTTENGSFEWSGAPTPLLQRSDAGPGSCSMSPPALCWECGHVMVPDQADGRTRPCPPAPFRAPRAPPPRPGVKESLSIFHLLACERKVPGLESRRQPGLLPHSPVRVAAVSRLHKHTSL